MYLPYERKNYPISVGVLSSQLTGQTSFPSSGSFQAWPLRLNINRIISKVKVECWWIKTKNVWASSMSLRVYPLSIFAFLILYYYFYFIFTNRREKNLLTLHSTNRIHIYLELNLVYLGNHYYPPKALPKILYKK